MLTVQNNFAYTAVPASPLAQSAPFTSPNAAGNGLIVVAYFVYALQPPSPNLAASDSQGNAYQSIGACGATSGAGRATLLQIWYVSSCRAGSNVVTVTEITPLAAGSAFFLAVSVFEYPGGLGAVDGSSLGGGVAPSSIALNLITAAGDDLLFGYAAQWGAGTVALDSNSGGYTTEQAEALPPRKSPPWPWIRLWVRRGCRALRSTSTKPRRDWTAPCSWPCPAPCRPLPRHRRLRPLPSWVRRRGGRPFSEW